MASLEEITVLLKDLEREVGAKMVRDACKKYLMSRTYSGELKEVRRPMNRKWVMEAFFKQNAECARCHCKLYPHQATGDHIIPLNRGGKHTKSNIRCLCKSCNSSKGDNTLYKESKLTGQTFREQLEP